MANVGPQSPTYRGGGGSRHVASWAPGIFLFIFFTLTFYLYRPVLWSLFLFLISLTIFLDYLITFLNRPQGCMHSLVLWLISLSAYSLIAHWLLIWLIHLFICLPIDYSLLLTWLMTLTPVVYKPSRVQPCSLASYCLLNLYCFFLNLLLDLKTIQV